MGDERLNNLLIITVESDEASKINLNETFDIFSRMKNHRYPLITKYLNVHYNITCYYLLILTAIIIFI
jgi:hypothetical protein